MQKYQIHKSCSRETTAPTCLNVLPENPGFRTVFKYDEAALFQYVYLKYRGIPMISFKIKNMKLNLNAKLLKV